MAFAGVLVKLITQQSGWTPSVNQLLRNFTYHWLVGYRTSFIVLGDAILTPQRRHQRIGGQHPQTFPSNALPVLHFGHPLPLWSVSERLGQANNCSGGLLVLVDKPPSAWSRPLRTALASLLSARLFNFRV
jgi:hypothetical protein